MINYIHNEKKLLRFRLTSCYPGYFFIVKLLCASDKYFFIIKTVAANNYIRMVNNLKASGRIYIKNLTCKQPKALVYFLLV